MKVQSSSSLSQRTSPLAGSRTRYRLQPFPTPAAKYAGLGLTQSLLHRMRELYAAEVTMVDSWLGRFLDDLANKGLLDKTLVVLCSDQNTQPVVNAGSLYQ